MTVESDIQFLIQLSQKELQIKEAGRLLETAPGMITKLDKEVEEMESRYAEAEAELLKLKKENLSLETGINDDRAGIQAKKNEQLKAKDNKEYTAKTLEIQFLEKKIDKAEMRILEIMELVEAEKMEFAAATEKINTEKESKLVARKDWEDRIEEEKETLARLTEEKEKTLPLLSDRVRTRYVRILKGKGDSGVANLIGNVCQGCFTRIPPQQAHEVRRNNAIRTCEACGRILIYFPIDEEPEA
jgi:predicted  nucleic acid-binding Zn-ribbon protein